MWKIANVCRIYWPYRNVNFLIWNPIQIFGCYFVNLSFYQICSQRGECFNMNARRDPTEIGTDEFGNSVLTYYTCKNGTCVEIYDLKCQRRCNEFEFDMRDKNSVIISEERIIIAKCSSRSSPEQSRITNDVSILWNRDTQYSKMLS